MATMIKYATKGIVMLDTAGVSSQFKSKNKYDEGLNRFSALKVYCDTNAIAYTTCSDKCISIGNQAGQTIFIRFYFNTAGGWGNEPYYSVGVYRERKTIAAISGHDDGMLLMTSQRGINGFENRFTQFIRDYRDQKNLTNFSLKKLLP